MPVDVRGELLAAVRRTVRLLKWGSVLLFVFFSLFFAMAVKRERLDWLEICLTGGIAVGSAAVGFFAVRKTTRSSVITDRLERPDEIVDVKHGTSEDSRRRVVIHFLEFRNAQGKKILLTFPARRIPDLCIALRDYLVKAVIDVPWARDDGRAPPS